MNKRRKARGSEYSNLYLIHNDDSYKKINTEVILFEENVDHDLINLIYQYAHPQSFWNHLNYNFFIIIISMVLVLLHSIHINKPALTDIDSWLRWLHIFNLLHFPQYKLCHQNIYPLILPWVCLEANVWSSDQY